MIGSQHEVGSCTVHDFAHGMVGPSAPLWGLRCGVGYRFYHPVSAGSLVVG